MVRGPRIQGSKTDLEQVTGEFVVHDRLNAFKVSLKTVNKTGGKAAKNPSFCKRVQKDGTQVQCSLC